MSKPCWNCHHDEAVWVPVIVFTHLREPVRGRLDLRCCDDCRDHFNLAEMVSDAMFRRVTLGWPPRYPKPTRGDMQLDFDLVDLDEDPMEGWLTIG